MKSLVIVGAGSHGVVVKEVAEAIGYERIAVLDDHAEHADGTIDCMLEFVSYEEAFIAIGNNRLRLELMKIAEKYGFRIPVLIHPSAYISKSTSIKKGTIIEPKAIVNTCAEIGEGCILSVGAIVDHHAIIEDGVHVNAGSIVKAGGHVEREMKLEAGEVILGYASAVVKRG